MAAFLFGCAVAPSNAHVPGIPDVSRVSSQPIVSTLIREGDPFGAIAVAFRLDGIAQERGPEAAVALSAILESRLSNVSPPVTVAASWDSIRIRGAVRTAAEGRALLVAIRSAALTPPSEGAREREAVERKFRALAARQARGSGDALAAQCIGDPRALPGPRPEVPGADTAYRWWKEAMRPSRVSLAVVGPKDLASGIGAVARTMDWGLASASDAPQLASPSPLPSLHRPTMSVSELHGVSARSSVSVTLSAFLPRASQALAITRALGASEGALAIRLRGLDGGAKLVSATAGAHMGWGCTQIRLELPTFAADRDLAPRIADAVALSIQEVHAGSGSSSADDLRHVLSSPDPRVAAELGAFWALVEAEPPGGVLPVRFAVDVGLPVGREGSTRPAATDSSVGPAAELVRALERHVPEAMRSYDTGRVESRVRVERGQGEMWLMLASPCGTRGEGAWETGSLATVITALGQQASLAARSGEHVESWISPEGVGLVVHGAKGSDETHGAYALRLADVIARPLLADVPDGRSFAASRFSVLSRVRDQEGQLSSLLGQHASPSRPGTFAPFGALDGASRLSDDALLARVHALRGGPMRVAVLANHDAAEADATVRAVDRWYARTFSGGKQCPPAPVFAPPRPGTYGIANRPGRPPEAWITFPLEIPTPSEWHHAEVLLAMLIGPGGFLSVLPMARPGEQVSAELIGSSEFGAIRVRVSAPDSRLDAEVARVREVLARVERGEFSPEDIKRAQGFRDTSALEASADPRVRLLRLFGDALGKSHGSVGIVTMRPFAARTLKPAAAITVVARPQRFGGTP